MIEYRGNLVKRGRRARKGRRRSRGSGAYFARGPENTRVSHVQRGCSRFDEILESVSSWLRRSRATGLRQHREMQTGAGAEQKGTAEGGLFQRDYEGKRKRGRLRWRERTEDEQQRILFRSCRAAGSGRTKGKNPATAHGDGVSQPKTDFKVPRVSRNGLGRVENSTRGLWVALSSPGILHRASSVSSSSSPSSSLEFPACGCWNLDRPI